MRNGNEQINPITRTNFRQREKITTGGGILLVTFQSFESITRLELTAEIIRTIEFFDHIRDIGLGATNLQ